MLVFRTDAYLPPAVGPATSPKRALEREQLRQKILAFQARMKDAHYELDKAESQIAEMNRSAVLLQKEQDGLKVVAKEEEERLTTIEQMQKSIESDFQLISLNIDSMSQIWNRISPMPAAIRKDQAIIGAKLDDLDQKQQAILKQALVIQNQGVAIGQNLLVAAQKADLIHQHAIQIQDNIDTMNLQAQEIEEEQVEMEGLVEELQALQKENEVSAAESVEEVASEEAVSEEAVSIWATIVQKVVELAAWCFATLTYYLGKAGVDVKKWLAFYHIQTPVDAINHPATWVVIGAAACAIVKNTLFTVACLGVEGSLFYYRWQAVKS